MLSNLLLALTFIVLTASFALTFPSLAQGLLAGLQSLVTTARRFRRLYQYFSRAYFRYRQSLNKKLYY